MKVGEKECAGGRSRAVALLAVLSLLSVLLLLVVSVLSLSRRERESAGSQVDVGRAEALRELVVGLVVGQLRSATGHEGESWVSQPGALRRYGASGDFVAGHRLYSAAEMVVGDEAELAAAAPAADWASELERWCDLNAPVVRREGLHFPVLDPRAAAGGVGHGAIEGFSISGVVAGVVADGEADSLRAPMPVEWLYVLRDGSLGVLDAGGHYVGEGVASEDNPIEGRVAFWADDETGKLNLNTASEATPWDTPRVFSASMESTGENAANVLQDRAYAKYQAAQREYQRYPGHPAMSSLGPVLFPHLALSPATKEYLYGILPRVSGGGSVGGSQLVRESEGLAVRADRLFGSTGELLFTPWRDREVLFTEGAIGVGRFFLSAYGRAPELTLWGTPRVAMWPTHVREQDELGRPLRTSFDQLIRFCSTVGGDGTGDRGLFGFQRADSESPTADWTGIERNREILRYLRALSDRPVPGHGGRLRDKLGERDRDQLLVQMLDYVRSSNLYDDNLEPKRYNSRAAPHTQFTKGRRHDSDTYGWKGHGEVTPLRVPAGLGDSYPSGIDRESHMGFGRFYTTSEVGLLFIACADGDPGNSWAVKSNVATGPGRNLMLAEGQPLLPGQRRVQMMVVFEWFCPSHGWTQIRPDFSVEVEQRGGSFRLEGQDLGIPSLVRLDTDDPAFQCWGLHPWGAGAGYRGFLKNRRVPGRGVMPGDGGVTVRNEYGLVSAPVTIDLAKGTMFFEAPEVMEVRIYAGTSYTHEKQLVQTIEIHFPAAEFPVPELKKSGTSYLPSDGQTYPTVAENWWTFRAGGAGLDLAGRKLARGDGQIDADFGRLRYVWGRPFSEQGTIIRPEDTFRSVAPYHGDYRLTAASHHVPRGIFVPTSAYFNTDRATAIRSHITGSSGANQSWHTLYFPPPEERLVGGGNYDGSRLPNAPVLRPVAGQGTMPSARFQRWGDFDNGIATTYDGAYINKPDEGNTFRIGEAGELPYYTQNWNQVPAGESYFSPNRQLPGPGMFGSLPARLASGNRPFDTGDPDAAMELAWRTLLFRPEPGHPGEAGLPDHLWLDLFWMPVVEPYALSEPFSTAGKINLNYQILPFPHLRRATALHGLLRSEEILAVRPNQANVYKAAASIGQVRYPIDADKTLEAFDEHFADGQVFRSASEICEIPLVPRGHPSNPSSGGMASFWREHALTGDNSRERPYTNLYSRVTVRSNTYRVHYRTQAIQRVRGAPPGQFEEGRDRVRSDLRGEVLLERFIDPSDRSLPDLAGAGGVGSLDAFYQYRVVEATRFSP